MKVTTFIRKLEKEFLVVIRDEDLQENIVTMTLSPEDFSKFIFGHDCRNVDVNIKTNIVGKIKQLKRFYILYPCHSHIEKRDDLIDFIKQQDINNFKDGWEFEDLIAYGLDRDDFVKLNTNNLSNIENIMINGFEAANEFTKGAIYTVKRYEENK